jgi:hypothetical protein
MKLLPFIQSPEGAHGAFFPLFRILIVAVMLLLLIIAANITNLLLAQASSRRLETAVRLAMGAGRMWLIRQSLSESILLALAGGGVGTVLSLWGVNLLSIFAPITHLPLDLSSLMVVKWPVLVFALLISLLTGLLWDLPGQQPALFKWRDTSLGQAKIWLSPISLLPLDISKPCASPLSKVANSKQAIPDSRLTQ